jgi:hypothetical protein
MGETYKHGSDSNFFQFGNLNVLAARQITIDDAHCLVKNFRVQLELSRGRNLTQKYE